MQAVRSGGDSAEAPSLAVNEPIAVVNARLLAAGWSWADTEEAVIWKGLDADTKTKVLAKVA